MSRINTNVPSLVAQRVLTTQNSRLNLSLERLGTGLRINTGKDDPAGLIASETLRAEKVAIQSALTNVGRAANIVSVAEAGLVEVNRLLTDLEDLVDRSSNEAGISEDERNANQLEIDAILDSINRIANSTEFQGRKLLSGEFAYNTSGVSTNDVSNLQINSARIPDAGARSVVVDVISGAQLAAVQYSSGTITGSSVTIEVAGNLGAEILTFGSGTTVSSIATAVNQSRELTGVSANVAGGTLTFNTTSYGSSQFVQVTTLDGTFSVTGGDAGGDKDFGEDATVTINGSAAVTNGLRASGRTSTLSIDIDLTTTFGTSTGTTTLYVVGGGADFMISPTVSLNGQASLGLSTVTSSALGSSDYGFLSSLATGQTNALQTENFATAQRIIRKAQEDISFLRGRLGAFEKDTLDTTSNALKIAYENTSAAESVIRDVDFANETSVLTRSQILAQSATNVLRLANAQPQQVLALLQ